MKVFVLVSNDLSTDQRVSKICSTLKDEGCDIHLVGRKLPTSKPIEREYKVTRLKLLFKKGPFFYAFLNVRLFFFLLVRRAELIYANDLDTLLAARLISRLKSVPLIYDTHEYFTEVPELQGRKAKKVWEWIEKRIFPKLRYVFTVNDSIAEIYRAKYGVDVHVMRNLPMKSQEIQPASRKELDLPEDVSIVILQGAWINVDRGGEEVVKAMEFLDNTVLLVIGGGDAFPILEKIVARSKTLQSRVKLMGKMPFEKLMQYTQAADLGVTMDKATNPNYQFSLPNKLFDYLKAGIPVMSSDLIEIRKVLESYHAGFICPSHNPEEIANRIRSFFKNEEVVKEYKAGARRAGKELDWHTESSELRAIIQNLRRE